MNIISCGMTDVGQVRSHNEDAILMDYGLQLYAVADGMGGHKGGEVASKICLDTVHDYLTRAAHGQMPLLGEPDPSLSTAANLLGAAVRFANRAVFEAASATEKWRGMGTTVVAVMVKDDRAAIAHVGDSRAYLLRSGHLEQVTQDHSWIEEQVRAGLMSRDEALSAPGRNLLTRAIGQQADVKVDLDELSLQAGDQLLLCSDGLHGMVADEEIAALVSSARSPEAACRELVACANGRGGRDNISVILLGVEHEQGMLAGVKRFFTKG